jgi:hypothetical protein
MKRLDFLTNKKTPKQKAQRKRTVAKAEQCINVLNHPERTDIDKLVRDGHTASEIAHFTTWWYATNPRLRLSVKELKVYIRNFYKRPTNES